MGEGGPNAIIMTQVSFDSQDFRRALGRFATGVAVVTARGSGSVPIGMTCNSFTSLSLEPPLVQWSIANNSRNYAPMCAATHFAVHVLDAGQRELCRQFSARDIDRFANVSLETGLHGLPLLQDYHARFECEVYARHEAGDHTIVVGRVLRLSHNEGEPLIFYCGALFHALSPEPTGI
ncbi:p-hydroxyphenylacetate 3-hydroxylase, reductase component [Paraburkholderia phenoliruptrix]|uniref:Flavin reductase FMN-binding protein domain-containing protein n=3 Tax=Paraburkholderia phenoliruptrix TaxID=252970 RepID=K0DYF8_9BURK|nr:flavin reductase FMN-binding protein domain-containing protein [Paraburkholderia phenoliruptrix BR3459a]CAB4047336.1 p-hydroxyphenylacetate 3-hydroxylase, reductase component [Paraburkholderia phenoliruptrix]